MLWLINDNLSLHHELEDAEKADYDGNKETAQTFSSLLIAA